MRNLAILTFLTLDGVMQSPSSPDEDNSNGFKRGGWAQDCWDEVMQQVQVNAMASSYDLLLGRKTYQSFAANFKQVDDNNPVAVLLNKAKKYVVTSSQRALDWNNSHSINGDVVPQIIQLKNTKGPLLQVHGSWQLIQTLVANDLIDEYRLWTFPVVVANGKRLFHSSSELTKFELLKSESCSCGAVMNIYHRIKL